MRQRKWLFAVSILPCFALSLLAQEATPVAPDAVLGEKIQVAEHSSRWDYPKEVVVPAGSQLHIVKKGDTFWDLGQTFLGNPFAWPQIWDQNKWVTDPHWIYPGDPIIIPIAKKVVATTATGPVGTLPTDVADLAPDKHPPTAKAFLPEYAYAFQDFLQLPYLAPKGAKAHFAEIGAVPISDRQATTRTMLMEGEKVYLGHGADKGVKVGDRLVALKVKKTDLKHPDTATHKKPLGDVIQQVGIVRVTEVFQHGGVAIIERAMDGIEIGDRLAPFQEPANIVNALRTDTASPIPLKQPLAYVLYGREDREGSGTGGMVIIDRGTKDGLQVGDVLLLAKNRSWTGNWTAATKKELTTEKTNYYLGQMMVVRADETNATCRILRSVAEITPGDYATK